ncbi:minor tail protein [Mycobacterium phage ArcherS7]|uniref:Minor tail protein n=10 Tax=Bixzunavirus TaxID=680114 RepID=G1BT38_9CAUD|nr:virion structural protein [Mycobacterium phage Gizmo]YP_008061399.1 virion structural protein [Mycobacterium phage ArcherS7]YP_010058466.1 virion structural protein [Mycobacterium phage Quasimodo]AEJ94844.1 hypothetical protein GHOST_143 [Mycobacterium phage Ghost]AEK06933.1 hypothetical protein DRAZDYS_142 [Mycobacterium phage Drazdys]AFL46833.1 hypothetical protein AVA3_145 [Mycobacterium phage Ava3]AGV99860.1 hypothetical protein PBI_SHRIMP_144 [Mycobacterium phage Shrimp]AID18221.1 hy
MASLDPFPLMPSKSTELRLDHFDPDVYRVDSSTILYKFVDALCGDAGAGSLKKEIFIQRLSGALTGIYGSDLDYIFGNVHFLSRSPSEAYPYNPMTDMLTSDQWDEVKVKDSWYRTRIREFFAACSAGGTLDGIRMAVHAACSVDCEVMENWRFIDDFGLGSNVGRAPVSARNEVTIRPHKTELDPKERRLLRDMLDKIAPQDTIVTISEGGLNVSAPVPVRAVAADSTYYQVEKVVSGTPVLDALPDPEFLAIDLDPTEKWLFSKSPELAPYAQFNITSEYGYYYLASGGARSPIDSVAYERLVEGSDPPRFVPEHPFEWFEQTGQFTSWTEYDKADSPDNYPGGKFGIHPDAAPALNPDHSPYQFPYASQQAYITKRKAEVIALGGIADNERYRLPVERVAVSKRTYTADLAIAYSAPSRDSTVTSSWTARKPRQTVGEIRDPASFIRA